MNKVTYLFLPLLLLTNVVFSQSLDDSFSQEKMLRDLAVFKDIHAKANSGLYKYRTKQEIDSLYNWAENEISNLKTYREFHNLICLLTDFEGSVHNDTSIPNKKWKRLRKEKSGYFPFPIKWIEGKWLINFDSTELRLGSEIISINSIPTEEIISELYKYYPTDGKNVTGKRIGIRTHFAKYFRLNYGLHERFEVRYKNHDSDTIKKITLNSISYAKYYQRFKKMHSLPHDLMYYATLKEDQKYTFKKLNSLTGILTIHTFSMGNESSPEHKKYASFLDSIFVTIKNDQLENLIVDVRQNGGGDDPNDLVTFSYLTQRKFQENQQAWISFEKIPLIKYYNISIPKFIRPLVVGKYNRQLKALFPLSKNGVYYQDENSDDHRIRLPNKNAFKGDIYLLISPAVASAGSLFAAMVTGNQNTTVIGEETMGGYYGHNGHTPFEYKLPHSKIVTQFSIVNLEQDVPKKPNQSYSSGIIPDFEVVQSFEDFLKNEDTQMKFVLDLINKSRK